MQVYWFLSAPPGLTFKVNNQTELNVILTEQQIITLIAAHKDKHWSSRWYSRSRAELPGHGPDCYYYSSFNVSRLRGLFLPSSHPPALLRPQPWNWDHVFLLLLLLLHSFLSHRRKCVCSICITIWQILKVPDLSSYCKILSGGHLMMPFLAKIIIKKGHNLCGVARVN